MLTYKFFLGSYQRRLASSIIGAIALILAFILLILFVRWVSDIDTYRSWQLSANPKLCAQIEEEYNSRSGDQEKNTYKANGKTDLSVLDGSDYGTRIYDEIAWKMARAAKLGAKQCGLRSPQSFFEYAIEHMPYNFNEPLWGVIITSASLMILFSSLNLYASEANLGWRRLSIVIGVAAAIAALTTTILLAPHFDGNTIVACLLFSFVSFPAAVLMILGGRSIATWIRDGFGKANCSPEGAEAASIHIESNTKTDLPASLSQAQQKLEFVTFNFASKSQTTTQVSKQDKIIAIPLAGPWRRFLARNIDIWLLQLPIAYCLASTLIAIDAAWGIWLQKPNSGYLFFWLCLPAVLLAEALVFGFFGNTPGKALLGLRVTTIGVAKPSFNDYLSRLVGVYWYGLGTGIPLVFLIPMISQYKRLQLGREATYDSGRFNVRGHPAGFFRIAVAIALLYLLVRATPAILAF